MRTPLVTISLLVLCLGAAGQARGRGTGLGGVPPLAGGLPGTGAPGSRPFGRGFLPGARFAHTRSFLGGYAPFAAYPDLVEFYPEAAPQPQVIVIRDEREQATPAVSLVESKLIELPVSNERSRLQPTQPTVLVWRNGQSEEVKQYTISGLFLYDYTKPRASRRISLDELDLDATERANQQRGVQFLIPAGPSEVTVRF